MTDSCRLPGVRRGFALAILVAFSSSLFADGPRRAEPATPAGPSRPASAGTSNVDELVLCNGASIRGTIVTEGDDAVTLRVIADGITSEVKYLKKDVASIRRADRAVADRIRLTPEKRPRREYRATTAQSRREGKLTFSDKLMMRMMDRPQRVPQGRIYAANFSAFLDAATLSPGDVFGISGDTAPGGSRFGPVQEGGGIPQDVWFEVRVLAVKRPDVDRPAERSEVLFAIEHMVFPHPDGAADHELAIPIKAVVVEEPRDDRPDSQRSEQEHERVSSAIGQMVFGVPGYFYGGAASVLVSKVGDFAGTDTSTHCVFFGQIKDNTPCFVRIDEDAVF